VLPRRVAITGLGLVTALGETPTATWEALLAGRFISDHSRAVGNFEGPRVCALACQAARQAADDAGWTPQELADAALVVGTSKGPVEAWLSGPTERLLLGLADVAFCVASALGMERGPRLTISTACASGLHALIRGAILAGDGAERVLVVAAESSLHPLFLASFKRLGVLAPPSVGCRPFDEERAGFLVSEAAAAVCLEVRDSGILLDRLAMAGDAAHITGGDPSGRTTRRLLSTVLAGEPVDLIHAHGTGTEANDATELEAIESVVGGERPVLYSHKGALGHTLGAAGLAAVVLNHLCHTAGRVPGNVRSTRPLPMERVRFSQAAEPRPIQRSLAIASGFGGAAAAVTLRGWTS
jgi:3-oxoacyl-[acyl-carrier-protein] synthase II